MFVFAPSFVSCFHLIIPPVSISHYPTNARFSTNCSHFVFHFAPSFPLFCFILTPPNCISKFRFRTILSLFMSKIQNRFLFRQFFAKILTLFLPRIAEEWFIFRNLPRKWHTLQQHLPCHLRCLSGCSNRNPFLSLPRMSTISRLSTAHFLPWQRIQSPLQWARQAENSLFPTTAAQSMTVSRKYCRTGRWPSAKLYAINWNDILLTVAARSKHYFEISQQLRQIESIEWRMMCKVFPLFLTNCFISALLWSLIIIIIPLSLQFHLTFSFSLKSFIASVSIKTNALH